ncbi:MAG TPA: serine/threonine-protein kinase [Gemmatimonadaceae bacterium]|nr:serine/threonine-protein kinase [Gemmatimonadaceae bacterium]
MSDGLWLFPDFSRVRAALAPEYTDLEEIASSATHSVFRARRVSGDDSWPVALKVALGPRGGAVPPSPLLIRSAEVTRRLKHPNVMTMGEPRTLGGYWICEMPLLSGHTIEHILQSAGRTTFDEVIPMLQDVGAALTAAHSAGVVHGALRPSCIHIAPDGRCIVTGFTFGADGSSEAFLDRPATPYEAPEQRRSVRVDGRADQYALAVIVYELMSGVQRAIRDENGVLQILPLDIPVGRPLAPGVPEHASAAIRKATAKDPAARFDSMGEFIESFTLGAASRPKPVEHIVRVEKPQERRSYASTIALVAMMVVSVVVVFAPQETSQALVQSGESVARWWKSWRSVDVPRPPRDDAPLIVQNSGGGPQAAKGKNPIGVTRDGQTTSGSEPNRNETSRRSPTSGTQTTQQSAAGAIAVRSPDRRETARSTAALAAAGVTATPQYGILVIVTDRGRPLARVNNMPRGRAPLAVRLRPGSYRVTLLTRIAYNPRDMQVTVVAGDTAYAEFEAPEGAFPDDTLNSLGLLSTSSRAGKYMSASTKGVAAGT